MKTKFFIPLLFIVMSFTMQSLSANEGHKSVFKSDDFQELETLAIREGKMLVVDFSAKWCLPCKWMEEYTFTDPSLKMLLSENFVSAQYDIQSFDGVALKQKYAVRILPTILILSPDGKEIMRFQESMSANALSHELKTILSNYAFDGKPDYKLTRAPLARRTIKSKIANPEEGSKNSSAKIENSRKTKKSTLVKSTKSAYVLQYGVYSTLQSAMSAGDQEMLIREMKVGDEHLFALTSKAYSKIDQAKYDAQIEMDRSGRKVLIKSLNDSFL